MTPKDFAVRMPRLYRLSTEGSAGGIRRHGLLCAATSAGLAGYVLPSKRRPTAIKFMLPDGTPIQITDNSPLSETRLAKILDDGLSPADWMAMLNARVFFWPSRELGAGNLQARRRFGYRSEWHIFDTRRLLEPVWDRAEIAPFNTGSTVRVPPRRGRATFATLAGLNFTAWRRRRRDAGLVGSLDIVKEVTVRGDVRTAGSALLSVEPA